MWYATNINSCYSNQVTLHNPTLGHASMSISEWSGVAAIDGSVGTSNGVAGSLLAGLAYANDDGPHVVNVALQNGVNYQLTCGANEYLLWLDGPLAAGPLAPDQVITFNSTPYAYLGWPDLLFRLTGTGAGLPVTATLYQTTDNLQNQEWTIPTGDLAVTFAACANGPLTAGSGWTAVQPEAGGLGEYCIGDGTQVPLASSTSSTGDAYAMITACFTPANPLLAAPTLSIYYTVYNIWSWEGTMGEGYMWERQESTDGTNFTTLDWMPSDWGYNGGTTPGDYYRIRVVDADHNPISEFSEVLQMPSAGYAAWASSSGIEWTWDYDDFAGWSVECSADGVNDWTQVDYVESGNRSYAAVTPGYYYRVSPVGSYLYSQVVYVPSE
jgi:hypothetical protein